MVCAADNSNLVLQRVCTEQVYQYPYSSALILHFLVNTHSTNLQGPSIFKTAMRAVFLVFFSDRGDLTNVECLRLCYKAELSPILMEKLCGSGCAQISGMELLVQDLWENGGNGVSMRPNWDSAFSSLEKCVAGTGNGDGGF
ncbi:hypothetical protein R6Q57_001136 [Mikania cordata]